MLPWGLYSCTACIWYFLRSISTFTAKRLFGYKSMVYASGAIAILGFIVWLHHFFTMGSSANVNAFFGIMTMVIAIPTGVKLFNWLFTMYRGRLVLSVPVLWTLGFMVTFTIGGMTGVLLAIPGADYYFIIACFSLRTLQHHYWWCGIWLSGWLCFLVPESHGL